MCGVVEVWASKGRHGENSFCSGDLCGGGEGSTGFLSSFSAWSPFGEAESPRGRSLLAGVKSLVNYICRAEIEIEAEAEAETN